VIYLLMARLTEKLFGLSDSTQPTLPKDNKPILASLETGNTCTSYCPLALDAATTQTSQSPEGQLLQLAAPKSIPYKCVNCGAPTGGVYYPYCQDCYKKSLDPKGGVVPIPTIIDPKIYQK
jgi:hypothetical protein